MFYSIALVLTTTGLALAATGEEDVGGCSKAGQGYSYMNARDRKRIPVPLGCNRLSGLGNFVDCVKTVCPCQRKACGDTCVPATSSTGQFQCQTISPANGPKWLDCVTASSVNCADTTTTTTAEATRRPFKLPETTPEENLTPIKTQVDCSKAGLKKMPTTKSELAMAKINTPPGCHMVPGQGIFDTCFKRVCPCKDKACGDVCVPVTIGTTKTSAGPFKCHRHAESSNSPSWSSCEPAASVKCAEEVTSGRDDNTSAQAETTTASIGTTKTKTTAVTTAAKTTAVTTAAKTTAATTAAKTTAATTAAKTTVGNTAAKTTVDTAAAKTTVDTNVNNNNKKKVVRNIPGSFRSTPAARDSSSVVVSAGIEIKISFVVAVLSVVMFLS